MCLEQDARPQSEKDVGGGAEEQRTAVSERLLAVSVEAGAPGSEPVHEHLRKVKDLVVEWLQRGPSERKQFSFRIRVNFLD